MRTAAALALIAANVAAGSAPVSFQTEVLPVLERHCFECHGPTKQRSGLRVDTRAGLLKGGDLGPALIPGNSAGSHLVELISSPDDEEAMPPDGKRLSAAEVTLIRRWIGEGAVWPGQMDAVAATQVTSDHWSFQPLAAKPAHSSIDGFVRDGLARRGLKPSPEADRRTLIRRLTLDLTGLPPSPADVAAFEHDRSPTAYEQVVDRLLASPHYGERWAQHWLDVIRYADTRGYEYNSLRENAWPFRDWVIDALNRDLPYDRFLFRQIAGDTEGEDPATGFLVTAPLPTPQEIGQEPASVKAARFNALDEVVQNVGAAMLGLTVSCARCHNHKFDPISQRDYYRVVSVFSGLRYESRPWRKAGETERIAQLTQAEQRAAAIRRELGALPHWRERNGGLHTDHVRPVSAKFVRLTVLATDAENNAPALDEVEIWSAPRDGIEPMNVALAGRGAKVVSSGAATEPAAKDGFLTDRKYGKSSTWISALRPPAWVRIELREPELIDRIVWSRDRESVRRNPVQPLAGQPAAWRIEVAERDGEWRTIVGESRDEGLDPAALEQRRYLEDELDALNVRLAELRVGPEVFAGRFTEPEPIHVLFRGDPLQPRDPVGPGALEIMHGFELAAATPDPERRERFARWLTTASAPLVARVAVNRVWHHYFGSGLVDTPGDFGTAGSRPTHPELLDWLARQLIAEGWSLKTLHRRIVTSATYRQRSTPEDAEMKIDPASRFLWRFPPRRLDAEAIRDSMLAVSGQLDPQRGGEGVNGFTRKAPLDQWKPRPVPPPGANRRAIYHTRIRGADDVMFTTFDVPDCGQVKDKRSRSTTPLQALNLLNGPFTLERSRAMAERLRREAGPHLPQQLGLAFELALSRPPTPSERSAATAAAAAAGLEAVCRALFNTNEFLFVP